MSDTELAIVIVSYNTRERTLACLRSIAEQPAGVATQVIVVDNDSRDGSAEAIELAHPDVTVIRSGGNLGFAKAVNLGVSHSDSRLVLLLNPDTVVLPGALQSIVEFERAHPENGVYGGRTIRENGELDPSSCWGAPTMWSLTTFALGLSTAFSGSAIFDPESLGSWKRDTVREVPIITGCLLLISRANFDRIGGMDEAYFLYGEDAEFSIRAARNGLRPIVVPSAEIIHAVGASTGARGPKMNMVMAGKVTMYRSIWSPAKANVAITLTLLGIMVRTLLERATGRKDAMWSHVWSSRRRWLPGYPTARRTLFGLEVGA